MGLTKKQVAKLKAAKDVRQWIENARGSADELLRLADDIGASRDGWSVEEIAELSKRGSNAARVKAACAHLGVEPDDTQKVTMAARRKALREYVKSIESDPSAALTEVVKHLRHTLGEYRSALVCEVALAALGEDTPQAAEMTSRSKRASSYMQKHGWDATEAGAGCIGNDAMTLEWTGEGWGLRDNGSEYRFTTEDITGRALLSAVNDYQESQEDEAAEAEPEEVVVAFWRLVDDEDDVFYCLHGGKRQTTTHPDLKAKLLRKAGFDWDGEDDNCWYCEKADWKAAREMLSDAIPGLTFKRRKAPEA